jgi:hypothetical protein
MGGLAFYCYGGYQSPELGVLGYQLRQSPFRVAISGQLLCQFFGPLQCQPLGGSIIAEVGLLVSVSLLKPLAQGRQFFPLFLRQGGRCLVLTGGYAFGGRRLFFWQDCLAVC